MDWPWHSETIFLSLDILAELRTKYFVREWRRFWELDLLWWGEFLWSDFRVLFPKNTFSIPTEKPFCKTALLYRLDTLIILRVSDLTHRCRSIFFIAEWFRYWIWRQLNNYGVIYVISFPWWRFWLGREELPLEWVSFRRYRRFQKESDKEVLAFRWVCWWWFI